MHESDWDYAEFWRMIQTGVIKEEGHSQYTHIKEWRSRTKAEMWQWALSVQGE